MKKIQWLVFFICIPNLHAQDSIKTYVKNNTFQIQSIDPGVADYSDLNVMGNSIGNSRIVMLGEQDHGDAPAFIAKTRIIKYLHEVKGFNVLAFESDFWGINLGWDKLKKEDTLMDTFLLDNIFSIWTDCDACTTLFYDYIPFTYITPEPLKVSGFDSQVFMPYSAKNMKTTMDSVFRANKVSVINWPEYSTQFIPLIDSLTHWYGPYKDTSQYGLSDRYLQQIKSELSQKMDPTNFWMMSVDNLIAVNYEFRTYGIDNATMQISIQSRDEQMAKNIEWLCNVKFPDEKIIIWAHNFHIAKYEKKDEKRTTTMGGFLAKNKKLIDQFYVLGFGSYSGTAGRLGSTAYKVAKPFKNGFENWINPSWKYSFTDLKKFSNSGNNMPVFTMKGWSHYNSSEKWTEIFDGIFFIRKMYPCQLIK